MSNSSDARHAGSVGNSGPSDTRVTALPRNGGHGAATPAVVIPFDILNAMLTELLIARSSLGVAGVSCLSCEVDTGQLAVLLQDVEERLDRLADRLETSRVGGGVHD